ncbi:hypothetical protein Tco_1012258 [Tanacetum coccineum]
MVEQLYAMNISMDKFIGKSRESPTYMKPELIKDKWSDEVFDALIDLPAYACVSAPKVKEHSQLLRLMQFLMGLDDVFSSVRTLILTIEPLPDVKSAFATLSRDDSHRRSSSNNRRFGRGSNVDMNGHTIDRCFELVGYPPGFKKNNGGQNSANNASIKSH